MAEKRGNKLQSYLLTILLLLLIVIGAGLLWPVYRARQKKQAELLELRRQLVERKAERNARAEEVERLKNSPDAVEKIAREKFRYANEKETVLEYPVMKKTPVKKQKDLK